MSEDVKKLVYDALLEKKIKETGCVRFNTASDSLRKCQPDVLDVIEEIVLNDIPFESTEEELFKKYPGLASVLYEYFSISNSQSPKKGKKFLPSLQGQLRIEALRALISIHYSPIPKIPVSKELIPILLELQKNGTKKERNIIAKLLCIKK